MNFKFATGELPPSTNGEHMDPPGTPEVEASSLARQMSYRLENGWDLTNDLNIMSFSIVEPDSDIDAGIEALFLERSPEGSDPKLAGRDAHEAKVIFDAMMEIASDMRVATNITRGGGVDGALFDPTALDRYFVANFSSDDWLILKYGFTPVLYDNSFPGHDRRREEIAATILLRCLNRSYLGTDAEKYLTQYIKKRTNQLLSWQPRELTSPADISNMNLRDGISVIGDILYCVSYFAQNAPYTGFDDTWRQLLTAFNKKRIHSSRPDLIFSRIRMAAGIANSHLLHEYFGDRWQIVPLETFDYEKSVAEILAEQPSFTIGGLMDGIELDRRVKVTAIEDPFFVLELYDDGQGNYWILLSAFEYSLSVGNGGIDPRQATRKDLYVARLSKNDKNVVNGRYRLPRLPERTRRRIPVPRIAANQRRQTRAS